MIDRSRVSIVTDWNLHEENALPDLAPGEEYERVFKPQKFVVLRQIIVRGPHLCCLEIGAAFDVPFELENVDGASRHYRPTNLANATLQKQLGRAGATVAGPHLIALTPGVDIRIRLRNEGSTPVKPRAAILVQEEIT